MSVDQASGPGQSVNPDTLVRCYAPAVLAVCLAHTHSIHDAEDAAQDTFVKAIAGLGQLQDASRIRPWLLQIARRVCIDRYRRTQTTVPLPDQLPATDRSVDPRLERLRVALSQLPDEYREPISLFYLDGSSSAAVAEALGISENAARQRLCRGRLMLHELMWENEP